VSEFKSGDKVLVEYEVSGYESKKGLPLDFVHICPPGKQNVDGAYHVVAATEKLHHHPGIPVADLVEECELAVTLLGERMPQPPFSDDTRWNRLRAARENAGTPEAKYKEGEEVWVRAKVITCDQIAVNCQGNAWNIGKVGRFTEAGDIRREEDFVDSPECPSCGTTDNNNHGRLCQYHYSDPPLSGTGKGCP